MWLEVPFGKYRGKSLPQIVFTDPDWFFWACEQEAFKSTLLKKQAAEVLEKASRIRIPGSGSSLVEYVIHPGVGKLAAVEVVPVDRPPHEGASPTRRLDRFDLSFARKVAPYDKEGGRVLINAVKRYVVGNSSTRMTRKRCEAFFDNPANFVLK